LRREWDEDYVDPRSLEFGTNAESMRVLVAELREMLDNCSNSAGLISPDAILIPGA